MKTRKILSFILALVIVFSAFPSFSPVVKGKTLQSSWTTNGIKYYGYSDGTAEIGGFESSLSGNITIPSTASGYRVVAVRDNAFSGNTKITGVTFSTTYFSTIGSGAFKDCTKLSSINFPSNLDSIGHEAFANCTSLASITFASDEVVVRSSAFNNTAYYNRGNNWSNGVLYIGNYLIAVKPTTSGTVNVKSGTVSLASWGFTDCSSVTNIVLPSTVKYIRAGALDGCTALTAITLPLFSSVSEPTAGGFTSFTNFFGYIFGATSSEYNVSNVPSTLKKVTLISPSGATSTTICSEYFYKCKYIEEIVLPSNLTEISSYGFYNCTALKKISLPQGLKTIESDGFYNCTSLQKISFPQSLKTIGRYAFRGCTALSDISFDGNDCLIEEFAFTQTAFYKNASNWDGNQLYLGTYFLEYKGSDLRYSVKEGTISIAGYAFYTRTLQQIYLPSSVKIISESAFNYANALERIFVSADNLYYSDIKGILYNKDQTEIIYGPSAHQYYLTVNYVDCLGNTIYESVVYKNKAGALYSIDTPKIPGYYTDDAKISGKMPADDIEITVVYYENALTASDMCTETIKWTLYEDGIITFKGTGKFPDYTSGNAPWAAYKDQIKAVYLDARITNIGAYAFENCTNLTFIEYGYSITSIGKYAFSGCVSLASFKLPESLTEVAEGAFFGCSSLKNLVIPDGITSIGDNAFSGCSEFVQITIGGQITNIGNNAFANCDKLTKIYFRGEPVALGDNALGDTDGKFVFYYSSVESWDDVISDGLWNGYTAVPYNSIIHNEIDKENFDVKDIYIIKVVDKHNTPLQNAVVSLGENTQSTNKDGMAYFTRPDNVSSLTVSCSNHITFTDDSFNVAATQIIEIIELSDKPSEVKGVSLNGESIATSLFTVNCGEEKNLNILISGYSKYDIIKYELYQGNRLISMAKTSQNQYTFTVKSTSFEEGETVFVKMYTSDGQNVSSALNIDVIKMATMTTEQILGGVSNVDLSFSLGDMGDYRVPISLKPSGDETFYTHIKGRTIYVGINLDIGILNTEDDKDKSKGSLKKMVDDSMENYAKTKGKMGVLVCGYVEIEYLGNDQYYVKTSYVKLGFKSTVSFNTQASFYGIVGVYFKASLSAKSTIDLTISRYEPEDGFSITDCNLGIEDELRLEGGAFLLWGLGSAGVYGEIKLGFVVGFVPKAEIESVYVSGKVGVTWSLIWGLWSGDHVIAEGDIYRWPEEQAYMMRALYSNLYGVVGDASTYEANHRLYLENRSEWLFGNEDYLQQNIYYNVAPKTVTCVDKKVMVWLDDNSERDSSNYQTLYYSVYENGVWSSPLAVDDNGTFDCEFDVYTDGEKIYVIYTEMTSQNIDISSIDLSDKDAISDLINGTEVFVSTFENGAFGTSVRLTHNEACELLPTLNVLNGKLSATWLQTDSVELADGNTGNWIYISNFTEEEWSAPLKLKGEQNSVSDIVSVVLNNKVYTAYIVDLDGSGETNDDQGLILTDENGESVQLDRGLIVNVETSTIDGEKVLTWYKNGKIYMTVDGENIVCLVSGDVSVSPKYQIVSIDEGKTLLTFVMDNGSDSGTDIYSIYINSEGFLTEPVRLTKTDGDIDNYSAFYHDEKLVLVFTETFAEISGDKVETVTHLRNSVIEFYTDISLNDVDFDIAEVKPNSTVKLTLNVSNNGTKDVDGITVNLFDESENLVYTTNCDEKIKSGYTSECEAYIVMPDDILSGEYTFEILPQNENGLEIDDNFGDNSIGVLFAYSDISVSAEQKIIGEKNYLFVTVSNFGNISSNATLEIYAPNQNDKLISSIKTTNAIEVGDFEVYLVDINAQTSRNDIVLKCVAVSEKADSCLLNNTDAVSLFHINNDVFTADPEQTIPNPEISIGVAEFDKYIPENIIVEITAGSESFCGIDGLTIGVDYTVNGNIVTVKKEYLSSLKSETHKLNFSFDFETDSLAVRTLCVTVSDSSPVSVGGNIGISGDAIVGNTIFANTNQLTPNASTFEYNWSIDGVTVGNSDEYLINSDNYGKIILLTVTATNGYEGSFTTAVAVAPNSPSIVSVEDKKVMLSEQDGIQYSMDYVYWQDSNIFEGLSPNREYTFYARVKATEDTMPSIPSYGTKVTTEKSTVDKPSAPIVERRSDCTVTLKFIEGYEYSMDGVNWQNAESDLWYGWNNFVGLSPNTEYTFYQRVAETETSQASEISDALVIKTWKMTIAKPSAPEADVVLPNSITLKYDDKYQYKLMVYTGVIINREPANGNIWGTAEEPTVSNEGWQDSNVFSDLIPNTVYVCFQRIKETDTAYASFESAPLYITTPKYTQAKAGMPILFTKSDTSITLSEMLECEYSIDGVNWQRGGKFDNLLPNKEYTLYQRFKETQSHYAGETSDGLIVRTYKSTVNVPPIPVIIDVGATTITIQMNEGYLYSIDGNSWQTDNKFENLLPNKEYAIYQKIAETETSYESEISDAKYITTLKYTVPAPHAPQLQSKTNKTIVLVSNPSMEFKIEGGEWTECNVFENLISDTTYVFYQRIKETETSYASEYSVSSFTTKAETELVIKAQSRFEKDEGYLCNVSSNQTAKDILSNFENTLAVVCDSKGNALSDNDQVGTGCVVNLVVDNKTIETIIIIVKGDLTGEGGVDTTDCLRIKSYFLGILILDETSVKAGDVDENSVVDSTDYMRVKSHLLGVHNLYE